MQRLLRNGDKLVLVDGERYDSFRARPDILRADGDESVSLEAGTEKTITRESISEMAGRRSRAERVVVVVESLEHMGAIVEREKAAAGEGERKRWERDVGKYRDEYERAKLAKGAEGVCDLVNLV